MIEKKGFLDTLSAFFEKDVSCFWQAFIAALVSLFRAILLKLLKLQKFEKEEKVPDLAPVITNEGTQSYFERLYEMLNRAGRVKEIAVTGPYGSGKSTLLSSFQANYPEYNIIKIALGNYQDQPDRGEDLINDGNEEIKRLERTVLKQLLYRHSDASSYGSRFIRTPVKTKSNLFTIPVAISLIFWFVPIFIAWLYGKEKTLSWLSSNFHLIDDLLSPYPWFFGFLIAIPVLIFHDIYKIGRSIRISKINPINGEFEVEKNNHESVFNLYLEEILAFFSRAKVDVVIFEDMDRFRKTIIFQRLKELNKIINDSDIVLQPVRFIYALKDNLFEGDERAKFFDAIIPVVPVVAGTNAYPQFKKLLSDSGIEFYDDNKQWDELIRTISIYVHDMRLLKNIVSEFLLYRSVLGISDQQDRELKLLAFMAYKNLHCDDFALLQKGDGKLADIFRFKDKVLSQRLSEVEAKIKSLREMEATAESEHMTSKEEVAMVLLYRLSSNPNLYPGLTEKEMPIEKLSNSPLSGEDPLQLVDDLNNKASAQGTNQRRIPVQSRGTVYNSHFCLLDIINESMPDYSDRLYQIDLRSAEEKIARSKKISDLSREKSELTIKTLSETISKYPHDDFVIALKDMPMVATFIRKEFIDADYGFYLSTFVDGHLTKKDMGLITALYELKEFDSDYYSDNYKDVVGYMNKSSCLSQASYNLGLLKYLSSESNPKNDALLNSIIHSQFINHEAGVERILEMSEKGGSFIEIVERWPNFIKSLSNNGYLDEFVRLDLLYKILVAGGSSLEDEAIVNEMISSSSIALVVLGKYENWKELLQIFSDFSILFEYSASFNMHFSKSNVNIINKEVLSYQAFILNPNTLMACICAINDESRIRDSIKFDELPISNLDFQEFLYSDPDAYIELIVSEIIKNIPTSEIESILDLDSSPTALASSNSRLIKHIKFSIEDLSKLQLEISLLEDLVINDRVSPTFVNARFLIDRYFQDVDEKLTERAPYFTNPKETLPPFFENPQVMESVKESVESISEESIKTFIWFLELIDIPEDSFIRYVEFMEYEYDDESIAGLDDSKLSLLLDKKLLPATVSIFNKLIEMEAPDLARALISRNEDEFYSEGRWPENIELDSEDLKYLITSQDLSAQSRQALILANQDAILDLLDPDSWLVLLLPQVNFKPINLSGRVKSSDLTDEVLDNFGIVPSQPELARSFVFSCLDDDEITFEGKLGLLVGQMQYLTDDFDWVFRNWSSRPKSLGFNDAGKLSGKLEYSDLAYVFCSALVYYGLISSFSTTGNQISIRPKQASRKSKVVEGE